MISKKISLREEFKEIIWFERRILKKQNKTKQKLLPSKIGSRSKVLVTWWGLRIVTSIVYKLQSPGQSQNLGQLVALRVDTDKYMALKNHQLLNHRRKENFNI